MRIFYFLVFSLLFLCKVFPQNKQLLYDFEEIPQSLLINPGMKTNYSWHSSVPMLGGISFYAGNSGATPSDLFGNDGIPYNDKFRDKVAYGMNLRDEISGNFQINIIDVGFRGKNNENYYSFGLYTEMDGIGYYPQDIITLAYEGNANYIGKKFDLNHIKSRGDAVFVYHVGFNKRISNQLTVGARAKLYSSIMSFQTTKNNGYIVTTQGENNLLRTTLDADVEIRTSGIFEIKDVLDDDSQANGAGISSILTKRALLGGNLGLGFDLGFAYNLDARTTFTASLMDIGFIYHTKDTRTYSLKGIASTEGVEVFLPADLNNGQDQWQVLIDDIEALIPYAVFSENYVTFRPTKLNASLRRDFGEIIAPKENCNCTSQVNGNNSRKIFKNSYGGHLYAVNRPRGPQVALTAFYQHRLGNTMTLKSTYTVDKFSYTNIGLGASLQAGPVNMYLLADNLLVYRNLADSHYASIQLGINIISWGKN